MSDALKHYYESSCARIKPGATHPIYYIHCKACKIYKRLSASPPIGPGGTLSCPYCKSLKINGPGMEQSYGNVKTAVFNITLPEVIFDED